MGRFTLSCTVLAIALSPACRGERSEQAGAPKTTEAAAAAEDEAQAALDAAREAKETAEAALETAREAQALAAAAAAGPRDDGGTWWTRGVVADGEGTRDDGVAQSALIEAERISVAGRITETDGQRVVVAPAVGAPLAVRVDAATQVLVNGQTASAAQLAPGAAVRLLYRLDGAQLIAERLDAER